VRREFGRDRLGFAKETKHDGKVQKEWVPPFYTVYCGDLLVGCGSSCQELIFFPFLNTFVWKKIFGICSKKMKKSFP
jgi:hypothetical protein